MITSAVFFLSFSDALVKLVHERFGLAQLFFLRSFIASLLLVFIIAYRKQHVARSTYFHPWITARSLLLCGMWACYYCALPFLTFAMAAAAMYTAPLFMALFSRLILKKPIPLRNQIALAIGFGGVLLALRPLSGPVSSAVILPFIAAACYALAAIITRAKCRHETALAMALNLNLYLAATGGIFVLVLLPMTPNQNIHDQSFLYTAWQHLDLTAWGISGLLGGLMAYIAIAVAQAYKSLSPVTVGLFDNAYLAFALVWGFVMFGDLPDVMGLLGIILIAGAAITSTLPDRPCRKHWPQRA